MKPRQLTARWKLPSEAVRSPIPGIGLYYNRFSGEQWNMSHPQKALKGAYMSLNFAKNFNLFGEYNRVSFKDGTKKADVFYGKLQYGKARFEKPQSWDLWVDYLNSDRFGYSRIPGQR